MARRSGDWHVVDRPSDPVPAGSYDVGQVAADYRSRAGELEECGSLLRKLADLDGWTGEAAEKFADKADDQTKNLGKAATNYDNVATALTTYAGQVATARTKTWNALQDAIEAKAEHDKLDNDPLAGVAEPTEAQLADRETQWGKREVWAGRLSDARQAVDDAVSDLEGDAEDCASAIKKANDEFSDGIWDDFKGWVRDHVDVIKTILEVLKWVAVAIAAIAIVVALFFTAPFWLTALLVGAAIALAVGILVCDLMLLSVDEATWGDIAWDVAGVVLAVVGGRAAIQAARGLPGMLASARTAAITAQQSRAAANLPAHVRFLRGLSPQGATRLTTWLRANLRGYADARHAWAMDDVIRNVDELMRVSPSALSRLAHLDTELATTMQQLRNLRSLNIPAVTAILDDAGSISRGLLTANWVGFTTMLDELSGLTTKHSPSDVIKWPINEIADHIEDFEFRMPSIP